MRDSETYYLLRRAEWTMGRIAREAVDGDEGSNEFGTANHAPAYLRARGRLMLAYTPLLFDSLAPHDLK